MNSVYDLLKALHPQELDIAQKHIRAFSSRDEGHETKMLQLLKMSADDSVHLPDLPEVQAGIPDDKELCRRLYGKDDDVRYRMLKSRLKNKILESLILDVNMERKDAFPGYAIAMAKAKKKILQINILISRGGEDEVRRLQDEIITLAKKYELYPDLIEILRIKKYGESFRYGIKEFQKLEKQISFYKRCEEAVYKTRDCYTIVTTSFNIPEPMHESFILPYLRKQLPALRKEYTFTRSAIAGYFLKIMEFVYYHTLKDYARARRMCLQLVQIIKKNPSVYLPRRIGIAFDYISNIEFAQGNFLRAASYLRIAQKYFPVNGSNYSASREGEFSARFFAGQYAEAEKIITDLLENSTLKNTPRKEKWEYFHAGVLFARKDFRGAGKILSRNNGLYKDKTGWNAGIRLLHIMTLIELREFEEAELQIEALRKHLLRNLKHEKTYPRYKTILQILRTLVKEDYDFSRTSRLGGEKKNLRALASAGNGLKWVPLSPELLPFHKWFRKK